MYITKIQKYLSRGRSKQEHDNLVAQIGALLELKYTGGYRYLESAGLISAVPPYAINETLVAIMCLEPIDLDNCCIEELLRNPNDIKIKPQPDRILNTHPMWLLWGTLVTDDIHYRTATWYYLQVFIMYMKLGEFSKAAKVYNYAKHIKVRNEPLPVLCPYVIQQVMFCRTYEHSQDQNTQ